MTLTTTNLNEYRVIPGQLRKARSQLAFLNFIKDFVGADMVRDEIARLQKRRRQLRSRGAY